MSFSQKLANPGDSVVLFFGKILQSTYTILHIEFYLCYFLLKNCQFCSLINHNRGHHCYHKRHCHGKPLNMPLLELIFISVWQCPLLASLLFRCWLLNSLVGWWCVFVQARVGPISFLSWCPWGWILLQIHAPFFVSSVVLCLFSWRYCFFGNWLGLTL